MLLFNIFSKKINNTLEVLALLTLALSKEEPKRCYFHLPESTITFLKFFPFPPPPPRLFFSFSSPSSSPDLISYANCFEKLKMKSFPWSLSISPPSPDTSYLILLSSSFYKIFSRRPFFSSSFFGSFDFSFLLFFGSS